MKTFLISFSVCLLICANVEAQKLRQNFERGFSYQYKAENTLGQYAFGYNEDHTSGGSFRRETGDRFGNKVGSYGLRIADGRIRIVNYVADHNGYRANVMTNEPGVSNQNSNGYFAITKKGFRGVIIPGLRNSAEAPHVTFIRGNVEESRDGSNHGNINEPRSTFRKSIDQAHYHRLNHGNIKQISSNVGKSIGEVHTGVNYGNINEPHSTISKSTDEPHTNVNHGNTNQQRSVFNKNMDEAHSDTKLGNIHQQRSIFNKNIDEARASINHGKINEEHPTFSHGNINEPLGSLNHDDIDAVQNAFEKDPLVAIPLETGLEEESWEDSTQGHGSVVEDSKFYAQANAVSEIDGAMGNRVPDLLKDMERHGNGANVEHRQSYTVELPESSSTESAIKDVYESTTSIKKQLTRQHD